jgi:hypothetical protein
MDRDKTTDGSSVENDHSTYNEEANMDRAAQSGSEGAFGEDNPDSSLEQMRKDAQDAFGETDTSGSASGS